MTTQNSSHSTMLGVIFITSLILFWVLLGFMGGFALSLVATLMWYKLVQKKPQLEKYWKGISVAMVTLSLLGIFIPAAQQDADMRQEKQEVVSGESTTYEYITEADSYERSVELLAIDVLGTSSEIERIGIENNELNIEYVSQGNITSSLANYGILKDAEDLIEAVSPSIPEDVSTINVSSSMELVDTYGNTSVEKVSLVTMNRPTWERINWDNFLTGDIPQVADYFWIHPSLN